MRGLITADGLYRDQLDDRRGEAVSDDECDQADPLSEAVLGARDGPPPDRADELRDPLVVDALDHDRSVRAVVELAETGHPRACLARNTGGTYPHGRRSQKLREVSLSHHLAAIDDRHRVANLLDLAQEVRVEEHHGPSVAEAADDLAHVVAA